MNNQRFVKITAIALLANLVLANFAFAQTSPPSTYTPPIITTQMIVDAKLTPAACEILSQAIYAQREHPGIGSYTANWIGAPQGCEFRRVYSDKLRPDGTLDAKPDAPSIALWKAYEQQDQKFITSFITTSNQTDANHVAYIEAQKKVSAGSEFLGYIIVAVLTAVSSAIGLIAGIAGSIFSAVVRNILTVTTLPQVVMVGWTVIRDVCNMFFILALIIISLGIILRLKDYQEYGHLIRELVIMAILVNFSQVIALTIMNFVNMIAAVFAGNGIGVDIFSSLVRIADPSRDFVIVGGGGWQGALVLGLGKILFMIAAAVIYIILAGMFVIRLVGLYVLIVFSPIAFVARILPATEKFSEEWWSHFLKYLIWAPVALFMIRLTIIVSKAPSQISVGQSNETSFYYFILLAFLAAAFLVAEEAGMVGSKMIVNAVEKGAHAIGHRALHYAGRKYNEATTHAFATPHEGQSLTRGQRIAFALANPVAAVRGWNQRAEELGHHAQAVAAARGRESVDTVMVGTTLPHAQIEERRAENEKLKLLIDMGKEQLMVFLQDAEKIKGHEGETTRLAAMKAALSNGYMDDILRMNHFAEKYGELQQIKDENGNVLEEHVVLSSPDTIQRFMRGYLGNGEQSMRFMAEDMEEAGKSTNHAEYLGHAYFDPDTKSFQFGMKVSGKTQNINGETIDAYENHHQADYAKGEWEKLTPNALSGTAPHAMAPQLAKVDRDASGKAIIVTGENGETGEKEIKAVTWGHASVTPSSEKFYKGITELVGEERVIDRFQNVQVRTKDRMLSKEMDVNGYLHIKNAAELKKNLELWSTQPDLAKAFYAQKLNVKLADRDKLTNLRIKYSGPDIVVNGVTYNSQTNLIEPSKGDIANFEELVKKSRSNNPTTAPAPSTPPAPRILGSDGRPVERDSAGNIISH